MLHSVTYVSCLKYNCLGLQAGRKRHRKMSGGNLFVHYTTIRVHTSNTEGMIIFRWNLDKEGKTIWTRCIWLRISPPAGPSGNVFTVVIRFSKWLYSIEFIQLKLINWKSDTSFWLSGCHLYWPVPKTLLFTFVQLCSFSFTEKKLIDGTVSYSPFVY